MKIIFVLIGLSLLLAIGFLISFLWAVKSGQYKDDFTPSMRILHDEPQSTSKNKTKEYGFTGKILL
ncbi:MAG: cbb3-type cytochrome oxidase assembly protein CcoS [Saprospiraceae bacterium]|nr:cbb3-type cytochrome oxidase assembly protein CcoS [Saprospiraceae bacterium]